MHEHNATPHLIEAMQWVACLSRSEAEFALRDYRTGRDEPARSDLMQWAGGEAVWSYGGVRSVIADAIKRRVMVRRCNRQVA
jgi:hypothetical protein